MTPKEIAAALRTRTTELGMEVPALARKCGLTTRNVRQVLSGSAECRLATVIQVAEALEFVALVVPRPLAPVVAAGHEVHEPRVLTRVQQSLATLKRGRTVLFLDLDGVAHAVGDSRIDDRGTVAGDLMFRWAPVLESILQEHPKVDVVVHSSWRIYWPTLESLSALLPDALAARVTAITDPKVLDRYESIQRYLQQHPDVLSHVILDDDEKAFPAGLPHLVVCDPEAGIGDPEVAQRLRQALTHARAAARPEFRAL